MDRKELLTRSKGLDKWIRSNRHHEFYNGVCQYHKRLLGLLYNSKLSN